MLKPLLRTIPTLSGNIKIACTLGDYNKINANDWTSYVRYARLLPLSSGLAQRNIEANLLFSSYDFDAQRFFKYYSAYFYDDCYIYDKYNYALLKKSEAQKNRNTDFEFGCKRVSLQKNEKQFAFYAPIYLESINDIPDYFKITIKIKNNKFSIEKHIKVNISDKNQCNYLKVYLEKYLSKLDSNVIFCNVNRKGAVYYGIDLVNGGFTKTLDNISAKAFTQQNTINNFDAIISNGFKRNNLAIRQILPLCWYFNVNDILSEEEIVKYSNSKIFVSGEWYKNGKALPFYNIDANYIAYYESPFIINKSNGMFVYKGSSNNIMNTIYPSLNESMYKGYRYTNKMNVLYNRWKLKYSDDEHPYITNLSPAFSMNQNSIYKYGGFPEKYKSLNVITDISNNIIIPIGNALKYKESPYINDYNLVANYITTLNNNVSTWYHLTNDISDIYNKDIWKDIEDNKVYYKGILYDFNKIYDEYPNLRKTIDKFSVIVNLHFNKYPKEELRNINKANTSIFISDKYRTDKTAWVSPRVNEGFKTGEFNKLPMFYNTASSFNSGNAQLVFDKLYERDDNGDFIDLISCGYNVYEINKYYKYSDILVKLSEESLYELTNNEEFNSALIDGYELLPIYKLYNMLHENNRDIVFEGKKNATWVLDNLYFSQHGNYFKSKYDRDTLVKLFKEYGSEKFMIPLYYKNKFISKANLDELLETTDDLDIYEYAPRLKDNTSATFAGDSFIKKDSILNDNYGNNIPNSEIDKDNDVLYIDAYNLNNVFNNVSLGNEFETYAKFLNMKHLLYYVSDLYKDASAQIDLEGLMQSLFIKKRVIIGNENAKNITVKDYYIPFYVLYDRYRPLTNTEKLNILDGDIDEYIEESGIYYKDKNAGNYYSSKSYRLLDLPTEDIHEYHIEDFYYKPNFYIEYSEYELKDKFNEDENEELELQFEYTSSDSSGDDNPIITNKVKVTFIKYLQDNVKISNPSLLKYLNDDLIEILLSNDINNLSIKDLPFMSGVHESIQPPAFNNPKIGTKIYSEIAELKKEIVRLINVINKNGLSYYKDILTGELIQYDNFRGVNEYLILDEDLKKTILRGNINIPTYIIDDNGEFIRKDYDTDNEYFTLKELDDTIYIKEVISQFLSDVDYFEGDNYFMMGDTYNRNHDFDSLIDVPDYDTPFNTHNAFEIVFKKKFYKINDSIYNLINLDNDNSAFKDLYIYRIYKPEEYPTAIRIYYTDTEDKVATVEEITNCLYPLFNDILLQDKKYTVIYSEYAQANIYKTNANGNNFYRYNSNDTMYMYDISDIYDKEFKINSTYYYTYSYISELNAWKDEIYNDREEDDSYDTTTYNAIDDLINSHSVLPTYSLLNNCYSTITYVSDDLNIYENFKINTHTIRRYEAYTYSYIYKTIENNGAYTYIGEREAIGKGKRQKDTTYGFILLDAYIDNTNSSFNIIDTKYKRKKYFTYINEHYIYDENYNVLDSFNLLVPFSNINLVDNLFTFNDVIIKPTKCTFNTYYKQTPLYDDSGSVYAYNINKKNGRIDTITLQRYFNSIVPYIPETTTINSSYCLKYKKYKYVNTDVNYVNDVFYQDNINIYNYNKLKVYDNSGSYTLFEPIEYKHFNDSKLINLKENFEISIKGTLEYNQILEYEKDDYVFTKFKNYILESKLNSFNDDEILFLFNRYKIKYDVECIGLNSAKTHKLYTLTYKFTLL